MISFGTGAPLHHAANKYLKEIIMDIEYNWLCGFVEGTRKLFIRDMELKNERSCGEGGEKPSDKDIEWFKKRWPNGASYHELLDSFDELSEEETSEWMWGMVGP
jgi:hypothetical protein